MPEEHENDIVEEDTPTAYDHILASLHDIDPSAIVPEVEGDVTFKIYGFHLPNEQQTKVQIFDAPEATWLIYWEWVGGTCVPQIFYDFEDGCCTDADRKIDWIVHNIKYNKMKKTPFYWGLP